MKNSSSDCSSQCENSGRGDSSPQGNPQPPTKRKSRKGGSGSNLNRKVRRGAAGCREPEKAPSPGSSLTSPSPAIPASVCSFKGSGSSSKGWVLGKGIGTGVEGNALNFETETLDKYNSKYKIEFSLVISRKAGFLQVLLSPPVSFTP